MYIHKRSVSILPNMKSSFFESVNKDIFEDSIKPLGTTTSANKAFLLNTRLIMAVMPLVLSKSPEGKDVNWDNEVTDFVASHTLMIPQIGKTLNASLVFDLDNPRTLTKFEALYNVRIKKDDKDAKSFKDALLENKDVLTEKLAKLVLKSFSEDQYVDFATPEEADQYISYRLCLYNERVANNMKAITDEDSSYEFYIASDDDIKKEKLTKFEAEESALDKYVEITTSKEYEDQLSAILCNYDENYINSINTMDKKLKKQAVFEIVKTKPTLFVALASDKRAQMKFKIRMMVKNQILYRIPSTDIYTDAADTSLILGNSIDEVCDWFANAINAQKVNEYTAKNR